MRVQYTYFTYIIDHAVHLLQIQIIPEGNGTSVRIAGHCTEKRTQDFTNTMQDMTLIETHQQQMLYGNGTLRNVTVLINKNSTAFKILDMTLEL